MRGLNRSWSWAWACAALLPILATLTNADPIPGSIDRLHPSAYITLDFSRSSPVQHLDIQLDVLPSQELCGPAHVIFNHDLLGGEGNKGNFTSLGDDIPFSATWNLTCINVDGVPTAQLLSFDLDSVSGVVLDQALHFSLQFKQVSPVEISDLEGPASMVIYQEHHPEAPGNGNTEELQFRVEELRRLRRHVVHLQRLISRKERHLARTHGWVEDRRECHSFACSVKNFLGSIARVAKSWFWDDIIEFFSGDGRHDNWRHDRGPVGHPPHWRHPHGPAGNRTAHDGWKFPPPWERPHHGHRPPLWPPPPPPPPPGYDYDRPPPPPHHPDDGDDMPPPPPGVDYDQPPPHPHHPGDRPPHHRHHRRPRHHVPFGVKLVLCMILVGTIFAIMRCYRKKSRKDTDTSCPRRRSGRRQSTRQRRAKGRTSLGRLLARLVGRPTNDELHEDNEERNPMLGRRRGRQNRSLVSQWDSDVSDIETDADAEEGLAGVSVELTDLAELAAEDDELPPYKASAGDEHSAAPNKHSTNKSGGETRISFDDGGLSSSEGSSAGAQR